MENIQYKIGDATAPEEEGNKIIVHICNDIGAWGKGFVLALSKRWKQPEKSYKEWFKPTDSFELGAIQLVQVESDIWVANLIGQHKIRKDEKGNPPIRYEAVFEGLNKVTKEAEKLKASVHMPRIGCGLAGGKWPQIEPLIEKTLIKKEIKTVVYDFK